MSKPLNSTLSFIKFSRVISYTIYAFVVIAVVSLAFGFFLLLFGANAETPFVKFIYNIAYEFMQPFRGIFPPKSVGETGYFSTTALFAIIVYLMAGAGLQSLISYINVKMIKHEKELTQIQK